MSAQALLRLAAAPAFGAMALAAWIGGPGEMICSAGPPSPLSGMVPMYLMMSAVHAGPWLTLLAGRRGARAFRARLFCATAPAGPSHPARRSPGG